MADPGFWSPEFPERTRRRLSCSVLLEILEYAQAVVNEVRKLQHTYNESLPSLPFGTRTENQILLFSSDFGPQMYHIL